MSVLIGNASIDERGKISGGAAGNQTGKELCTRNWYAGNWGVLLRCKNEQLANMMAISCERACKNPCIGYDQNQRNSLKTQAMRYDYDLSAIKTPCECDCSSLMVVCTETAGIAIPYSGSNAPTTSTMKQAFLSTGFFEAFTDSKYLTSDKYLKRGDILVRPGHHTVMVLQNGSNVGQANNVQNAQSIQTGSSSQKTSYEVGKTYTLDANLYIRDLPFGNKVKFSCITVDAQKKSKFDSYGNAILQKGTRVTCKAIKKESNSTWMLIPSGWICAIEDGKVYIK